MHLFIETHYPKDIGLVMSTSRVNVFPLMETRTVKLSGWFLTIKFIMTLLP